MPTHRSLRQSEGFVSSRFPPGGDSKAEQSVSLNGSGCIAADQSTWRVAASCVARSAIVDTYLIVPNQSDRPETR